MAINLSAISSELRPGLLAITGKYDMIPTQFNQVFKKRTSNMAVEITSEMRFLPIAQIKGEGQNFNFDGNAGDRLKWNQEHIEVGLGYVITQKALEDNLYKSEFPGNNLGLAKSFTQFKEIVAANVFNLGNTTIPGIGGDNLPLFSTAHPIDGGVFANRPTIDVDLGESTLLAAQSAIPQNFRDQAGLKVLARAEKLLVHRQNEAVAIRLTKTELRPGTSDNDVNAIRSVAGGLSGGYMVLDFLTNPYAWFLTTNIDGLLWLQRRPFAMDMHTDFQSNNLMVKGRERYSFGYNNSRSVWGTFPTS